jgi:hypothetical protein
LGLGLPKIPDLQFGDFRLRLVGFLEFFFRVDHGFGGVWVVQNPNQSICKGGKISNLGLSVNPKPKTPNLRFGGFRFLFGIERGVCGGCTKKKEFM